MGDKSQKIFLHNWEFRKLSERADELACFGWVQALRTEKVVGEVRCNKLMGSIMKEWILELSNDEEIVKHTEINQYEDTKIKLHFSHFKVLGPERVTCFPDHPHQCK